MKLCHSHLQKREHFVKTHLMADQLTFLIFFPLDMDLYVRVCGEIRNILPQFTGRQNILHQVVGCHSTQLTQALVAH